MEAHLLGLLIGGLCPALFFALTGVFARLSGQGPVTIGGYVLAAGVGVVLIGIAACIIEPRFVPVSTTSSSKSLLFACFAGITWGLGTCLLIFAIAKYGVPLSQLAPLYNTNTLIAVFFGLLLFREWQLVSTPKILLAAVLIMLGDYLVLFAKK